MIHIGDRLAEERLKKGLTIDEVAKATKIRPHFIIAIEKGDYKKLPSSAYTIGFVKNYIAFLGLPQKELLAMFRREFNEKEYLGVLPESFIKGEITIRKVRLWQTFFIIFGIFLLFFVYIFFQYKPAFISPMLTITSPKENEIIHDATVIVSGITETNTTITVDTIPAYVDASGHFKKDIPLFSGKTMITVKAMNAFGKTSTIERHIIFRPS